MLERSLQYWEKRKSVSVDKPVVVILKFCGIASSILEDKTYCWAFEVDIRNISEWKTFACFLYFCFFSFAFASILLSSQISASSYVFRIALVRIHTASFSFL